MDLLLANPRGFCAGVNRAIEIVERALSLYGKPIYVRHEVVHNTHVVESLRTKGAIFVEDVADIPEGAVVVFSAHGVSKAVRTASEARGLQILDATCPLVTKVHVEVLKVHRNRRELIVIGHAGHPEIEGTMGQIDADAHLVETTEDVARLVVRDPDQLSFVTQTTLSVDDAAAVIAALRLRFPDIAGPKQDDICYATQNRQDAVKALASEADVVIVVGSPNSSNSNRLREVAANLGARAYMVDSVADFDPAWVTGCKVVGVTAGASAPEGHVQSIVEALQALGVRSIREVAGAAENVLFPLPRILIETAAS